MTSWGITGICVSSTAVLFGVLWPNAAETFLRMLIVAVAVGAVTVLVRYSRFRPVAVRSLSPFDREPSPADARSMPRGLHDLTNKLAAASNDRWAQRTTIPLDTRTTIHGEMTRRLAEHHQLRLGDPADQVRVHAMVSPATWTLLREMHARQSGSPPPPAETPHLSDLRQILDDLEQL